MNCFCPALVVSILSCPASRTRRHCMSSVVIHRCMPSANVNLNSAETCGIPPQTNQKIRYGRWVATEIPSLAIWIHMNRWEPQNWGIGRPYRTTPLDNGASRVLELTQIVFVTSRPFMPHSPRSRNEECRPHHGIPHLSMGLKAIAGPSPKSPFLPLSSRARFKWRLHREERPTSCFGMSCR